MNKLEREENLINAFSFFDKDGSGYITIDELAQACKDFGLDDVHLDEMIKEIDQNNVGSQFYGSRGKTVNLPRQKFSSIFLCNF